MTAAQAVRLIDPVVVFPCALGERVADDRGEREISGRLSFLVMRRHQAFSSVEAGDLGGAHGPMWPERRPQPQVVGSDLRGRGLPVCPASGSGASMASGPF